MTKATKVERDEAIAKLRTLIKPGDTVTTTVLHVAKSGMSRVIMCQIIDFDDAGKPMIRDISWLVARAIGVRLDQNRGGVVMGGCGMNMCFAVKYDLGRTLFPDGFATARGRNGDTSGWDNDGGYALAC